MTTLNPNRALVVLSGGQDSTTCLFWAKSQGFDVHAITFDYGQRHSIELEAAKTVATYAGIGHKHLTLQVPGVLQSASPLTSPNSRLETYESFESMEKIIGDRVEKTFVPMRNMFFLTLAANYAVSIGAGTLVAGMCQEDNANYPDCTQKFVERLEGTINESLGLKHDDESARMQVLTPLMHLSKADTVRLADQLDGCMEALAYSHTAYSGEFPPITQDHATVLRAHGFEEAGLPDPLIVRAWLAGLMPLPATKNYDVVRNPGAAE